MVAYACCSPHRDYQHVHHVEYMAGIHLRDVVPKLAEGGFAARAWNSLVHHGGHASSAARAAGRKKPAGYGAVVRRAVCSAEGAEGLAWIAPVSPALRGRKERILMKRAVRTACPGAHSGRWMTEDEGLCPRDVGDVDELDPSAVIRRCKCEDGTGAEVSRTWRYFGERCPMQDPSSPVDE